MKYLAMTGVVVVTATAAWADVPGSLNFANETSTRISSIAGWENPGNNVKEVKAADFDQDGDLDVGIAIAGGVFGLRQNKLYLNNGGAYDEVSNTSILLPNFGVDDLSRHLFFRDYDADGWLDLVVVNDDLASGGPIKIYMNQHPGGVFSHFTEEHLSRGLNEQASCGAISEDVDNDGDYDVYSGNYPGPSQDTLFLNDGTGNFTIVTSTHVPPDGDYTIDVASADMNGDGKLDLLISNHNTNYAYYNDLLDQGEQGVGDYRFGSGGVAGRQNLTPAGADGAMEPGDFNGDGLMDFYWSNKVGSTGDRIMVNQGNDGSGNATFAEVVPPAYATSSSGNKISVADLNGDGRPDVVVGTTGRPAILRNTSVNGVTSFVDWAPAPAFPSGSVLRASHVGLFDSSNDGDVDMFLGGNTGDHLFEQVATPQLDEADLGSGGGGTLPAVHDQDPLAVTGQVSIVGEDQYVANLPGGSTLSVIVNGDADYRVDLLNFIGAPIATSDRGGLGVEEVFSITIPATGVYLIRIAGIDCNPVVGDVNGDCSVSFADILEVIGAWGPNPGHPADVNGDDAVNFADILVIIGAWGPATGDYTLEVLSRTG
ncbi:MAG: hypothetical protein GY715_16790 [Planctomycetes bacterium]|nr:hypothetical protein [Planctomycetota bacterium]